MRNYSTSIARTAQTSPAVDRNDQVKNNAGGYVFKISPQQLLERFLMIGTEGGTYYVGEQKLTEDNARGIIQYIKTDGLKVVETVVDVLVNNRAPKADAGLFVLALASTYGDAATKKASYDAISKVSKTPTQLFTFLANIKNLRGWSRGLRTGVSKFYLNKSLDSLAYQIVKYRDRAGFTHRDALRLSHPYTTDTKRSELLKYAVGKTTESIMPIIRGYELAKLADVKALPGLIKEYGLTWEMIPTDALNEPAVLDVLLDNMPTVALIRNLNRFANAGLTVGNSATTKRIVAKLTNEEEVARSGVHPLNVANSMLTYSNGTGFRGGKTWEVNQNIVDALTTTFEIALKTLVPSGKNILVAVDRSGSMNKNVGGTAMTAAQVGNVLAMTILKSEKNAELIQFDTTIHTPSFGRRSSLDEVIKSSPVGGGTDCSLAFKHALDNLIKYDAILILTDNETWAGPAHGHQLLAEYRRHVNPNVKVVEVAMVATPFGTLPEDDPNLLRVVGFDSSVVDIVNSYLE